MQLAVALHQTGYWLTMSSVLKSPSPLCPCQWWEGSRRGWWALLWNLHVPLATTWYYSLYKLKKTKTQEGPPSTTSCYKTHQMTSKCEERWEKTIRANLKQFLDTVHLHNWVKKASVKAKSSRSALKQERAFRKNPWSFTKSVCCLKSQINPSFTMEAGYHYFKYTFEACNGLQYSFLPFL